MKRLIFAFLIILTSTHSFAFDRSVEFSTFCIIGDYYQKIEIAAEEISRLSVALSDATLNAERAAIKAQLNDSNRNFFTLRQNRRNFEATSSGSEESFFEAAKIYYSDLTQKCRL